MGGFPDVQERYPGWDKQEDVNWMTELLSGRVGGTEGESADGRYYSETYEGWSISGSP